MSRIFMKHSGLLGLVLCLANVLVAKVQAQSPYFLVKAYEGPTFFDDWIYFDNPDNITNGDVIFVSRKGATQSQLTFVNEDGNAVLRVDNSANLSSGLRSSVRISTADSYGIGSVWIADILHGPFGCSVWPFWSSQSVPSAKLPAEIDTFSNFNLANNNDISFHTNGGCFSDAEAKYSGLSISTDCSPVNNNNRGCIIQDSNPDSFGENFSRTGGGIFVTEYGRSLTNVWYFPRNNIPSFLDTESLISLETTSLGVPVASYPNASCEANIFGQQQLTFYITLCGDRADSLAVFNETCPGSCYQDWVLGPPSNYDNAYFEIRSVKVFQNADALESNGTNGIKSPISWLISTVLLYLMLAVQCIV